MAESSAERIATELMSEPHIVGRRISVLHVYDWVEGRGDSPKEVAETFDLDVADVYHTNHSAETHDLSRGNSASIWLIDRRRCPG